MDTLKIAGGCLCGAVRFAFEGTQNWVLNCHCETCRRATSSPMTTWVSVPLEGFSWQKGATAQFSSSPGVTRRFCGACGSPLSYESTNWPGEIHLYAVSFDDPNMVAPTAHVFHGERLDWFEVHDALPRYETTRGGGTIAPYQHGPDVAQDNG